MSDGQDQDELPGWIGLTDHNSEYNSIAFQLRQQQFLIRTNVMVKIVEVHAGQKPYEYTVDVQPLVKQIDGTGQSLSHGVVYGIPMANVSGQNGASIIKPKKNDIGMIMIGDRDMSSAIQNKGEANPGSRRIHDFSDGVYLGGFNDMNQAAHHVVHDEDGITVKSSKHVTINTDQNVVINATKSVTVNAAENAAINAQKAVSITSAEAMTITANNGLSITGNLGVTGSVLATSTVNGSNIP